MRAALALLTSLDDAYNLPRVLASLSPEARAQAEAALGPLRAFNPANPTGSYVLNLSQVVDNALANRLLTCWAVEVRMGICKPAELQARLLCMIQRCAVAHTHRPCATTTCDEMPCDAHRILARMLSARDRIPTTRIGHTSQCLCRRAGAMPFCKATFWTR